MSNNPVQQQEVKAPNPGDGGEEWKAEHHLMPTNNQLLRVTGRFTAPTPGYGAELVQDETYVQIPENPPTLALRLEITKPSGMVIEPIETVVVKPYEEQPYDGRYEKVHIKASELTREQLLEIQPVRG